MQPLGYQKDHSSHIATHCTVVAAPAILVVLARRRSLEARVSRTRALSKLTISGTDFRMHACARVFVFLVIVFLIYSLLVCAIWFARCTPVNDQLIVVTICLHLGSRPFCAHRACACLGLGSVPEGAFLLTPCRRHVLPTRRLRRRSVGNVHLRSESSQKHNILEPNDRPCFDMRV